CSVTFQWSASSLSRAASTSRPTTAGTLWVGVAVRSATSAPAATPTATSSTSTNPMSAHRFHERRGRAGGGVTYGSSAAGGGGGGGAGVAGPAAVGGGGDATGGAVSAVVRSRSTGSPVSTVLTLRNGHTSRSASSSGSRSSGRSGSTIVVGS